MTLRQYSEKLYKKFEDLIKMAEDKGGVVTITECQARKNSIYINGCYIHFDNGYEIIFGMDADNGLYHRVSIRNIETRKFTFYKECTGTEETRKALIKAINNVTKVNDVITVKLTREEILNGSFIEKVKALVEN